MRKIGTLLALGALAATLFGTTAPEARAAGTGAIVVDPSSDLIDGEIVTVTGSGWEAGHEVGLCQAVPVGIAGPQNCAAGAYTLVTVDTAGGFTQSLTIRRRIFVPSLDDEIDCADTSAGCVVGAADTLDVVGTVVVAPISFGLVPDAPTILSAAPGYGSALVSWAAAADGGSPITGYWVTAYVGFFPTKLVAFGPTATTQVVTGLDNGVTYRFKVRALNSVGKSAFSSATNPVTPVATVPGVPTIGGAVAGDGEATVSWTAPSFDGGSPITGYWVTAYVGFFPTKLVVSGSTDTTQVVTGLDNGVTYRFKVRALNAFGKSGFSDASGPVTPTA